MLIAFSGLPATGKTTVAKELARQLKAAYVRIDSIEQTLRDSMVFREPLNDTGYLVAYAVALDNLRLGRTVVADCVNPLTLTRDAWSDTADRANVPIVEVEMTCSNAAEHRRRVQGRVSDIPGLKLPQWDDIVRREYDPWTRDHIILDSAKQTTDECVKLILSALAERRE